MATATTQPSKPQQMVKSRDHRMFSASDDTVMMKQIQATHCPDGLQVDVKPILQIIEYILRRVTPSIDGVLNVEHLFSILHKLINFCRSSDNY